MTLRSKLGLVRRQILYSLYSRSVPWGGRGPIVSFSFDDFPRTAYTVGGPILERFGARGTYYAAIGLMGTCNELGEQFCLDDLQSLLAEGHELASHTFSHVSCRSLTCGAFRREVEKGRKAIEELAGSSSSNFAFPFGDVTVKAKRAIGMDMASCRGVWSGPNGPVVDLNLLRANSLYGDRDRFAEIQQLLLENERRKGWLIFYSHDVSTTPSRFGCTPGLLECAVSFAAHQGARVMTVAGVVADLVAQPAKQECVVRPA